MRNINPKPFIYILIGLSALLWFGIATLEGVDLREFADFLRPLPKVISIDILLYFVFVKWAWRWKIFKNWLVPFPDLNGTWVGTIQSTWKNPDTNERLDPIPAMLTIQQSFTGISCAMRTAEMTSHSYAEGFRLEPSRQLRKLTYAYTSTPSQTLEERSNIHEGTASFELVGTPPKKLRGRYWTSRKTTGDMTFVFATRDRFDDFSEEFVNANLTS